MKICWHSLCSHCDNRETCEFFRFSLCDIHERENWKRLIGRPDEPGPGAFVCSCHFPFGKREYGPRIFDPEAMKTFSAGDVLIVKPRRSITSHIVTRKQQHMDRNVDLSPSDNKISEVINIPEKYEDKFINNNEETSGNSTDGRLQILQLEGMRTENKNKIKIPSDLIMLSKVMLPRNDEPSPDEDSELFIKSRIPSSDSVLELCDLQNTDAEEKNKGSKEIKQEVLEEDKEVATEVRDIYEDYNTIWLPEAINYQFIPEDDESACADKDLFHDNEVNQMAEAESNTDTASEAGSPHRLKSCLKRHHGIKNLKSVSFARRPIVFPISPRRDEDSDDEEVKVKKKRRRKKGMTPSRKRRKLSKENKEQKLSTSAQSGRGNEREASQRRTSTRTTFGNLYHITVASFIKDNKPHNDAQSPPKSCGLSSINRNNNPENSQCSTRSRGMETVNEDAELHSSPSPVKSIGIMSIKKEDNKPKSRVKSTGKRPINKKNKPQNAGCLRRSPRFSVQSPNDPTTYNDADKINNVVEISNIVEMKKSDENNFRIINHHLSEVNQNSKCDKVVDAPNEDSDLPKSILRIKTPDEIAKTLAFVPEKIETKDNLLRTTVTKLQQSKKCNEVNLQNPHLDIVSTAFCKEICSTSQLIIKDSRKIVPNLGNYLCWACGTDAHCVTLLQSHILTHHWTGDPTISCVLCSINLYSNTSLVEHLDHLHSDSLYCCPSVAGVKCSMCDYVTNHYAFFLRHLRVVHQPEGSDYRCMFCASKFISITTMIIHIVTNHSVGWMGHCNWCEHAFFMVDRLRIPTRMEDKRNRPFCCTICKFSTTNGNEFLWHCVKKHTLNSQLQFSKSYLTRISKNESI